MATPYEDKTLTCIDCGAEFVWSAGEQEFFAQKGFDKPPTRCPEDRKKRRMEKEGRGPTNARPASAGPRTMYPITCANCGKQGEVPFQPKSANVLCADCFRNRNAAPAVKSDDTATAASNAAPAADEEPSAPEPDLAAAPAPAVETPTDDSSAAPAPPDEPAD